ncbi:hypothetical protein JB92DRAFT_92270 [Gautieria morchelliformis]|nr:hypothetical protein JB92DRAFT_92270 [Gautieria morchelliformis]
MASTAPLVLAISFWCLVYIRRRYVLSNTNMILPVTAPVHPQRASRVLWTLGRYFEVDLTSHFVLRGRTELLVDGHAALVEILRGVTPEVTSPSRRRLAKQTKRCGRDGGSIVRLFYNFGSVTAVIGQTLAVGALWWSMVQLGRHLLGNSNSSSIIPHNMVKRNSMSIPQPLGDSPNDFLLRPLIPGVNLPLSHLFPIIVSLMLCTTIHELGHAIAAAADGVPLVSWGYSLILVIPAAFVELATSFPAARERSPLPRLRITSAGVYHNLITLLVLFFISNMAIDRSIWPLFGYREIGSGVVVVDVHVNSPLRPHLLPGSIVTRFDDAELSKSSIHTPSDLWSSLLLKHTVEHEEGWCVDRHWFEDHSQGCCPQLLSRDRKLEAGSCFIPKSPSLTSPANGWCIDPVPLFEDQTKQRCMSHPSCGVSHEQDRLSSNAGGSASVSEKRRAQICITPHSSAALHRISFLTNAGDIHEKTIVWKGPRREVWEQVTVGKYLPRFRILPLALPAAIKLQLEYLRTVSLSLFFFNVLPVRYLDGGEILSASLALALTVAVPCMTSRRGDTDLEMGAREWGNQPSAGRRRVQQIEAMVEMMTGALICIVSIGGLLVFSVG